MLIGFADSVVSTSLLLAAEGSRSESLFGLDGPTGDAAYVCQQMRPRRETEARTGELFE
jgi:hypothetical protein